MKMEAVTHNSPGDLQKLSLLGQLVWSPVILVLGVHLELFPSMLAFMACDPFQVYLMIALDMYSFGTFPHV